MKLTQRDIPRLPAGEYRDDELDGLLFRVRDTGLRAFELRYTSPITRRRRRLTIGRADSMTLDEARKVGRKLIGGVWTGSDPAKELRQSGGLTVGQITARYLSTVPLSASTLREWPRMARVDFAPIAAREAATLRRAEISEWASAIAQRAGYVANRAFAMLRRVYSWSVEIGILEASPFVRLKPPFAKERKRKRVLTVAEIWGLMNVLDELANPGPDEPASGVHFADGALLLLLTGVRLNSMIEARRGQFHRLSQPDHAEWRIPPAFQKLREKDRASAAHFVVPLSRQAREIVLRRFSAVGGAEILFPRTRAARGVGRDTAAWGSRFLNKVRDRVDERLGRDDAEAWSVHCFRHTITTHLEEVLATPPTVTDAILSHKADRVSASHGVYSSASHLSARRAALQDWADWIDSIRRAPLRRESAA